MHNNIGRYFSMHSLHNTFVRGLSEREKEGEKESECMSKTTWNWNRVQKVANLLKLEMNIRALELL